MSSILLACLLVAPTCSDIAQALHRAGDTCRSEIARKGYRAWPRACGWLPGLWSEWGARCLPGGIYR